jgi:hypothetical protein
MNISQITALGMPLEVWEHKSCRAEFGVGDDWATLYGIQSKIKNKGHATELLIEARKHYEAQGKKFGGTVALSEPMAHIYKKLGIKEYND